MKRGRSSIRNRNSHESGPKEAHLRILEVIRRIPRGRVATYGDIARLAGLPGRARLVGHILRSSVLSDSVPWHRVLNAMGRISPRPGDGANHQRRRLVEEGIRFGQSGRIDLVRYRWKPQKKRG